MTVAERNEIATLTKILDTTQPGTEEWDKAYNRYCEINAKAQARYRAENIDKLKKFYDEHIAGKTWEQIDPEGWDFYSDFHKDVFGYRPRTLNW